MSWMNGNLDKVQNKYKCSCGAESVHGVYDDENNHIGEFCDPCFGVYLINQGAGHDLDISTSTYKELVELRKKQARLTQRALDGARFCPACHALLEEGSVYCDTCGTDTPRQ